MKITIYKSELNPKPIQDNITVKEVLDKTGTYKGIKGSFTQEGQTVIFKEEGKERVYEITVLEIKKEPHQPSLFD